MADRLSDACEDMVEGLCHYAKHFNAKAKKGHATAADVGAILKLLPQMGGELRDDHPEVAAIRDEVMESIRDLDLDDLH